MATRTSVNKLLQELRALAQTTNRRPYTGTSSLWETSRPPIIYAAPVRKRLRIHGVSEVVAAQAVVIRYSVPNRPDRPA